MFAKVLIANRGEIAVRIARALAELDVASVAVFAEEDAASLHVLRADQAVALAGRGAAAYLDQDAVIAAARATGCDAVHPGYGFLAENAGFARRCAEASLVFIGPSAEALALFGDKAAARRLALAEGVPLAAGTTEATTLEEALAFARGLSPARPVMLKAIAGGGGRGIRIVENVADLPEAFARASSEAQAAFGVPDLYIEELITGARHLEVQVAGDRGGEVMHVFERECSLQRRQQKLIEIAPAPMRVGGFDAELRDGMFAAALRLARAARVHTLCTFEFLVDERARRFVFMEANPRLQVEHTVTEEVMGVDLVQTQIALAAGSSLAELGLSPASLGTPRGFAVELRVNMERIQPDGSAAPTGGTLTAFEPPSGAGIRVDTFGYPGYATTTSFDPLLAKVIVSVPHGTLADAFARGYRALCELRIDGVHTNVALLQALLLRPELREGIFDTRFVERHLPELLAANVTHPQLHAKTAARVDATAAAMAIEGPEGSTPVVAPMGGHVVAIPVKEGDAVSATTTVAVIEAMKMEQAIVAGRAGVVRLLAVTKGDRVAPEQPLVFLELSAVAGEGNGDTQAADTDADFAHLAEVRARQLALLDEARGEAVEKYRKRAALTARERIAYLCDEGSFHEIGGLIRSAHAASFAPADGIVGGSAKIDGRSVLILSQDFSVYGGSSGRLGGVKMERVARQALQQGLPLVMLLDGGGHRIQDGQSSREYAPAMPLFHDLARMSGWVPMVSAVLGAGFASNTNYSGMADFVVMVRGQSTMGLAGPALVRAGTGEEISIEALGGAGAQVDRHGLADHATESEETALDSLRRFLAYLPANAREPAPRVASWAPSRDAGEIASIVPANSRRSYDVRRVVRCLADEGSVFEVKPTYARNIVTSLARMGGRPVGFIANQPLVQSGMLDSPACEKASHFIALCDAFGLPLLYLMDVPGASIGSPAERTMLGRRSARMLFELGHATVPRLSVILRKGYGLGYVAMNGGRSFDAEACFAWPTAEICAMSVEGSVDVAFRRDYEKAEDPAARRQELIDEIRARISPVLAAEGFGVDDVIEPAETRDRLLEVLDRVPGRRPNEMPPKYRSISPI
jgi:acetyl/propionyl-CoA carboxylase alpha subunit/acetyl-CoA carboxylase carboxyltransferase component